MRRYFEMCAYILILSEYFVCKLIFQASANILMILQ
jgi:hypothetical protein